MTASVTTSQAKWRIEEVGPLTLVFSPLLSKYPKLVHAFTTRLGGSSPKPIDSFNLSLTRNVEGAKKDAAKNRRQLCRALKLDYEKLVVPYQTHSHKVAWLSKTVELPDADGIATASIGLPVLLQYADCVPIILYDTKSNAFAVLHAGWRGTASAIATKGLKLLLEKTGSAVDDIAVAIGPAIGSCCYPTGPEVPKGLASVTKNLKGLVHYRKGMPHPDLKGVNAQQLKEAGVKHIDVCPMCTSCNPRLFYSHRKSQGKTGHQGAIAALATATLLFFSSLTPLSVMAQQVHLKALTPKLAQPEPESAPVSTTPAVPQTNPASAAVSSIDSSLEQLEKITFGEAHNDVSLTGRLALLEESVFHTVYEKQSNDERIKHLLLTLLGDDKSNHATSTSEAAKTAEADADMRKELSTEELYKYALNQINSTREEGSLHPLEWDETALKVAQQHARELCHQSSTGVADNPDLSYTKLGGTDALTESVVSIDVDENTGKNKATVTRILQAINKRQDDRDSVFGPDATHFGLAYVTANGKIITCFETVTKHSAMHSIPKTIRPGEKIEVKGVVKQPYHFKLISIAWEGENKSEKNSNEDASLYFPPLDYVAYGQKGQKGEHEKLMGALRITGVVAALAGGMFIPPIAIAAPLIAMSGSMPSEPHAISEIPVRGGVKVTGDLFYATIPVSHQNKEGLYYVTVWASRDPDLKPIPISRRVIVAKAEINASDDSSIKMSSQEKPSTVKAIQ